METVYFVKVDVAKLRDRLTLSAPMAITDEDVGEWLINRGFRVGIGGWYATQDVLDRLASHLILSRSAMPPVQAHAIPLAAHV